MRVDGQLLASLEIKVQNFEVRRVMDEKATQAAVLKTVFLKHAYFFHAIFTPFSATLLGSSIGASSHAFSSS
jgi:hypothetical protein